ncbi:MAG TPA: VCBS repeat-containing protein, partial [Thermoanaerobaculia bacterium]|nr:VCBS repeat-containing protein [Thermoanaerobaculia bacterium]
MKFPVPLLIGTALLCSPLAAEQSLFRNSAISFGGGTLLDMKAADVNHDGKQDVILFQAKTESQSACSIITMFGSGDGTFRPPVKTPIASCGSVAFGDLDSDGNVDVVLSGHESVIEVYRGNSDGSFTLRSTKNKTGSTLYGGANLLLSDLNGDGKLDLIIPASCCQQTETFRGNGDGTFADAVLQPDFVTGLTDIVAADFNGDGRTDMLATTGSRQSLITGKGDGKFNAPTVLSADGRVAVAGDFNGDLKTDYVAMGAANAFAFVHIGKGDGTFTTGATYITGPISRAFPVDIDGDGKLDIVAAGKDILTVLRGNGDGTFVVNSYALKPRALDVGIAATFAVADFDGDHLLDVMAGSDTTLTFFHGNGDGSLAGYRKA